MKFAINARKMTDPEGTYNLYTVSAIGMSEPYDAFLEWINTREIGCEWRYWPCCYWMFTDPVDDVAIRVQWSEYFCDAGHEYRNYIERYPAMTPHDAFLATLVLSTR